ncbi:uncharacterized protein BCR38DRAFT_488614 [Pseudomassariella vexata]|uniref:Cytochrome P450 n=1 Tax=Pseudomassariella vexata TaxID=1141098 RepID=A0A1Y2DK55_9PEZI|nr:uncharacterized protein BCR38DRAFT_488614 [Pseudomassariella vexata]ORY59591.1 hypothetical protein BCR38DRAFT_488614 [Pseudomassariella vexata]
MRILPSSSVMTILKSCVVALPGANGGEIWNPERCAEYEKRKIYLVCPHVDRESSTDWMAYYAMIVAPERRLQVYEPQKEGFSDGIADYIGSTLLEAGSDTTAATLVGLSKPFIFSNRNHFTSVPAGGYVRACTSPDWSLFLVISRLLYAFDFQMPVDPATGEEVVPDMRDLSAGIFVMPRLFGREIASKSEPKARIVREERGNMDELLDREIQWRDVPKGLV